MGFFFASETYIVRNHEFKNDVKYHILRFKRYLKSLSGPQEVQPVLVEDQYTDRYHPPGPDQYLVDPPEKILSRHAKLISSIRRNFSLTDDEFDQSIMPAILHFAKYIHLLPSSKDYHHFNAGGAIHHSLQVANFCLIRSNTLTIKPKFPPSQHSTIEQDTQKALFLGGLWHDSGKPITDMSVITPSGKKWHPITETLYDFMVKNEARYYNIEWDKNRSLGRHDDYTSQMIGVFISKLGIDLHPFVHHHLTDHFQGKESIFTPIIKKSDQDSTAEDLHSQGANTSKLPISSILIEGLQANMFDSEGALLVNDKISTNYIFHSTGMYVRYPQGLEEAFRTLKVEGRSKGLINSADRLGTILLLAGYLTKPAELVSGKPEYVHELTYIGTSENSNISIERTGTFIKFKNPHFLLDTLPDPIDLPEDQKDQTTSPITKTSPKKSKVKLVDDTAPEAKHRHQNQTKAKKPPEKPLYSSLHTKELPPSYLDDAPPIENYDYVDNEPPAHDDLGMPTDFAPPKRTSTNSKRKPKASSKQKNSVVPAQAFSDANTKKLTNSVKNANKPNKVSSKKPLLDSTKPLPARDSDVMPYIHFLKEKLSADIKDKEIGFRMHNSKSQVLVSSINLYLKSQNVDISADKFIRYTFKLIGTNEYSPKSSNNLTLSIPVTKFILGETND